MQLLHRKALALTELHDLAGALGLIEDILSMDPGLQTNPEIAGLEGRIYRQKWESSRDEADLDAAIEAYRRAYDADPRQFYPGINAASLSLARGDEAGAKEVYETILSQCRERQDERP